MLKGSQKQMDAMGFPHLYKGDYRVLAILPLLVIAASFYFIPQIELGVEFTGGTLVSFVSREPVDAGEVEALLAADGLSAQASVSATAQGHRVEILLPQEAAFADAEAWRDRFSLLADEAEESAYLASQDPAYQSVYAAQRSELLAIAQNMSSLAGAPNDLSSNASLSTVRASFVQAYTRVYNAYQERVAAPLHTRFPDAVFSLKTVSPTLSVHFLQTAINVVLIATVLSIVLVFLFFRSFVPSLAVIVGAFSDIAIALGAMGLFHIPLTLPSLAALLMLIGFSLDTDILLTSRMLKREGNARDNAHDAMKTGITMSTTTLLAFGVLFALALFTRIPTYTDIASVALAGLVGDLFATWGLNAVLVLFYLERKSHAVAG